MSFLWVLVIVGAVLIIPFIIWGVCSYFESVTSIAMSVFTGLFIIIVFIFAIIQPFSLRKESIRQLKEREQIEYQISMLDENSDKVKLNEWILTYNDWVNEVNTSKEAFGWRSWYYTFDMTEHTIIKLV